MNKLLSMIVLVPSIVFGAQSVKVSPASIISGSGLGSISVRCTKKGFKVRDEQGVQLVERGDTDPTLRHVNPSNLAAFVQAGKILVSKTNDGKYILRSHINGLGGGPMFGAFAYWATKSLCYGTVLAGAGAVAATGIGAVGAAVGAGTGAVATGTAMGIAAVEGGVAATAAATGVTGIATVGAGVVSAGLGATAGGTAIATTTTVAAVTSTAATTGGLVGFIETLSLGAWVAATSCPFLP